MTAMGDQSNNSIYRSEVQEATQEELIEELNRIGHNHAITTSMDIVTHSKIAVGAYLYNFGSFNEAIKLAENIEIDFSSQNSSISVVGLIGSLHLVSELLGHPPRSPEFSDLAPVSTSRSDRFGDWKNTINQAGLSVEKLRPEYMRKDKLRRNLASSVKEFKEDMGRVPTLREITDSCGIHAGNVWTLYGNWEDTLQEIGYNHDDIHSISPQLKPQSMATVRLLEQIEKVQENIRYVDLLRILPDLNINSAFELEHGGRQYERESEKQSILSQIDEEFSEISNSGSNVDDCTNNSENMTEYSLELSISSVENYIVLQEVNSENYTDIDEFVDECVGNYVSSQIDQTNPTPDVSDDDLDVVLPPHLKRAIELRTETDSVEDFVHNAIYSELDLESEEVTLTVDLSRGLYRILSTISKTSDSYEEVKDIVEDAISVQTAHGSDS